MRPFTPSTQHPWSVHPVGKPVPRGAADEVLEVVVIDTKVDDDVPDVVEELVDPVGFGPTLYNSS